MVNVFATANGVCFAQSKLMRWAVNVNSAEIVDKSADYLLTVKGNQGSLEQAFNDYYKSSMLAKFDVDSYSSQDRSHGRLDTRSALVNQNLSVLGDLEYEWLELKSMGHHGQRKTSKRQRNRYQCATRLA